jgi:phosphoribosylaminoimidazole-succinocarboxamide synthase
MDFLKPRSHRMTRRRRIYEGKAKVLYEGPEPGTLIQYFKDDATAFNAKKHEVIEGKGVLNNRISEYVFQRLNDIGVPTHFIRRINMREQLIREVEIIPLEVVVRNVAAGSLSTRLGLEEGTQLPRSIIEFYYKNDQLNDPMVSEEHITAFGWAAPQEIDDIMALATSCRACSWGLASGSSTSRSKPGACGRARTCGSCSPTRSAPTRAGCGTSRPTTRWTRTASARTSAG